MPGRGPSSSAFGPTVAENGEAILEHKEPHWPAVAHSLFLRQRPVRRGPTSGDAPNSGGNSQVWAIQDAIGILSGDAERDSRVDRLDLIEKRLPMSPVDDDATITPLNSRSVNKEWFLLIVTSVWRVWRGGGIERRKWFINADRRQLGDRWAVNRTAIGRRLFHPIISWRERTASLPRCRILPTVGTIACESIVGFLPPAPTPRNSAHRELLIADRADQPLAPNIVC